MDGLDANNQEIADNNSDLTLDFGFYQPMSIGNRVWRDAYNDPLAAPEGADKPGDGILNLAQAADAGINDVTVQLYRNDGDADFEPGTDDVFVEEDLTANGGFYLFDNLIPGDYWVFIPVSNFDADTDPLWQHISSDGIDGTNTDDETDLDDNGINQPTLAAHIANGVRSALIQLRYPVDTDSNGSRDDTEPAAETNLEPSVGDGADVQPYNSELTVDFGFYVPPLSLGNRVWFDADRNGLINGAEEGINDVTVYLFRDANSDGIPDDLNANTTFGYDAGGVVDPGDIVATDITTDGGYYLFGNLLPGNYVVWIAAPNFQGGGALLNHISTVSILPGGALSLLGADTPTRPQNL
ncbi:MAG: hypothetical protein HC915_14375, partial [Anaerolineae bacterium]|nr:hypothetical protein [Anaerolineae bacterium]